jgi:hypothetical protein
MKSGDGAQVIGSGGRRQGAWIHLPNPQEYRIRFLFLGKRPETQAVAHAPILRALQLIHVRLTAGNTADGRTDRRRGCAQIDDERPLST